MRQEDNGRSRWTAGNQLSLIVFVALGALISAALLIEVKSLVLSSPGETLNHLFASGGFTLAASGILLLVLRERPRALAIMAAGTAITIFLEAAQALVPTRDAEIDDLLAGLAGVLLASIVLEAMLIVWSKAMALRVHVIIASLTSVALVALLMTNWGPGTVRTERPDGTDCPLTEIATGTARFDIATAEMSGSCMRTASGGLGLVGNMSSRRFFDRAVLVTSDLDDLRDHMQTGHRLHLRTAVTTDDFNTNKRGVIALLRTNDGRHVVNVRSFRHRLEVTGPNLDRPLQPTAYAQVLEQDTQHILDIELHATQLFVSVDGREVARTTVDPSWLEALQDERLQLLIGNNAHRSNPFRGAIEWIEVDT